jgi:phosphatidylserine decarboxylase
VTWISGLVGIAVAAILLLPLALKWQLPLSVVGSWTVVVGVVSGALWSAVFGEGPVSWAWLLGVVLSVLLLSAAGAAFAFFRDPERGAPNLPGAIVSPADGTVLYIRRFGAKEAPPMEKHKRPLLLEELAQVSVDGDGLVIGVGMHLLNVHVNRAPVAGRAATLLRTPGRFVSLKRDEATTVNERFTTVIEGDRVRVVVVQIASRLVRRIVSYLEEGEDVVIGQRIGMIKFGSQVDVILPDSDALDVRVKPGDIVRAGVSVLGFVDNRKSSPE